MAKKKEDVHGLPSLAIVLGYIAVKESQTIEDKIKILTRLGYGNEEMARICGTSRQVISTIKSALKKRKARKK